MHRLPLFYFASIASALVAYLEIHRSSSIWGPRTEVRNQDVIPRRQSTKLVGAPRLISGKFAQQYRLD